MRSDAIATSQTRGKRSVPALEASAAERIRPPTGRQTIATRLRLPRPRRRGPHASNAGKGALPALWI
jgi:hypothetical protein